MPETNQASTHVPFTSGSSLAAGLRVRATLGGGAPHAFLLDTGSVGILTPRSALGPDFQQFDPSQDIKFQYVSSGKTYWGQWVKVPVVLGVPADWDGTGDYPVAQVEVFAVDRPVDFDGGVFGIGFGIDGHADGGPARNPLLHMSDHGERLNDGYIVSTRGVDVGLTAANTAGFAFIALDRNDSAADWRQPLGSVALSAPFSPNGFAVNLPILVDTGIKAMILWVGAGSAPPELASGSSVPDGVKVSLRRRRRTLDSNRRCNMGSSPEMRASRWRHRKSNGAWATASIPAGTSWPAQTISTMRQQDVSASVFRRSSAGSDQVDPSGSVIAGLDPAIHGPAGQARG